MNGDPKNVTAELKKYQNDDGGFGGGLEPDFLLPESSPMATTISFQILDEIEVSDDDLIKKAIHYFEKAYNEQRLGWMTVGKNVNDYPHAPWWDYDKENKCTVIDKNWGNPSSEIIGTLYQYKKHIQTIDIERILDYAIRYLNGFDEFKSEHEIYCYIRLYEKLPKKYQEKMRSKISAAITQLICLDENQWKRYVPKPFDFVQSKKNPLFNEIEEYADRNCDYFIETIENGIWFPNWKWNQYENDWEKSKKNWTGYLTIKYYKILKEFNRIE
jgi:hypothetical protein